MSKLKTLGELRELAKEVFKAHPNENEILVTEDGNFFLKNNENSAKLHANNLKIKVQTLYRNGKVEATEEGGENKPTGQAERKNAKNTIEDINNATTVEAVEALIEGEERSSVLKAAAAKIKKFNQ
jgi:hypothetical protein